MSGFRHAVSDTLVLAKRSLLRIPRAPDLLLSFGSGCPWVFASVAPAPPYPAAPQWLRFSAIFPPTSSSSPFVPVDPRPRAPQPFPAVTPSPMVVNAARSLFRGPPAGNNV